MLPRRRLQQEHVTVTLSCGAGWKIGPLKIIIEIVSVHNL